MTEHEINELKSWIYEKLSNHDKHLEQVYQRQAEILQKLEQLESKLNCLDIDFSEVKNDIQSLVTKLT